MGTLRSSQWTNVLDVDGEVVGQTPTCKGFSVNGITLGEPAELDGDPATVEWNDGRLPNGECEVVDGEIVVTVDEEPR